MTFVNNLGREKALGTLSGLWLGTELNVPYMPSLGSGHKPYHTVTKSVVEQSTQEDG